MSSHKEDKENDKLKHLLDQNRGEDSSLDDFEKEALEGFDLLESKEEALELKNGLDSRIYSKVFVPEKKSRRAYWYAAAGLLLIIGFSIYFLRLSPLAEEKDLAVQTSVAEIQEPAPLDHTAKKEAETFVPAPEPAVQVQAAKPGGPSGEKAEPASLSAKGTADLASGNAAAERELEENTIADNAVPFSVPIESKQQQPAFNMTDAKARDRASDKDERSDSLLAFTQAATAAPAPGHDEIAAVEMKKTKEKSLKRAKSSENANDIVAQSASAGKEANYPGGAEALQLRLKKLLELKALSQAFEASLLISTKGRVEKVTLYSTGSFNAIQKEELRKILMQLDNFQVPGSAPAEYKLSFRP